MIGIIIQLAISWLLIWLFEKGNPEVLGLIPTKRRLADFFLFLLVTALCCATGFVLRMWIGNERWMVNPLLSFKLVLDGLWWNIKSVLFEELIFRGVLFYILIKRTGALKALIISSIAFGIYHWFTYEILGDVPAMIYVFFFTGIVGMLYGYGYIKTGSIYAVCAIHLGWNFTNNFLFSEGNIGNGILIAVKPGKEVVVSYFTYYFILLFPILLMLVVNFLLLWRRTSNPRRL